MRHINLLSCFFNTPSMSGACPDTRSHSTHFLCLAYLFNSVPYIHLSLCLVQYFSRSCCNIKKKLITSSYTHWSIPKSESIILYLILLIYLYLLLLLLHHIYIYIYIFSGNQGFKTLKLIFHFSMSFLICLGESIHIKVRLSKWKFHLSMHGHAKAAYLNVCLSFLK